MSEESEARKPFCECGQSGCLACAGEDAYQWRQLEAKARAKSRQEMAMSDDSEAAAIGAGVEAQIETEAVRRGDAILVRFPDRYDVETVNRMMDYLGQIGARTGVYFIGLAGDIATERVAAPRRECPDCEGLARDRPEVRRCMTCEGAGEVTFGAALDWLVAQVKR